VAADESGRIIESYDAALPLVTKRANRVSYVIAPDGRIVYEYTSLSPDEHVKNTLAAVKQWAAEHPHR
jgi:peroxiredoxin (alkyl hydroperoxide reductase subunit C)